jgi:pyruvate-ferredoxin/flavodoxin oxidoreductase
VSESTSSATKTAGDAREIVRFPGIRSTADGSAAVVWVESHIAQGASAHPITPSTPIGDGFGVEFANGKKNLWGERLEFFEPVSEHRSASICDECALVAGRIRVDTWRRPHDFAGQH